MLILGIESSCDETAMAVVQSGKRIFANCMTSQADLLQQYGGVFPELASRRHLECLRPLLTQTLQISGVSLDKIDAIAVTQGPGLIGSLLIGIQFAKGLSLALNKPLIGVNHLEAHLYAALMEQTPPLPALGLVISGGHTSLVMVKGLGDYELIGQTQDDAIGEAFDKVARLLNLPTYSGAEVEKWAIIGSTHAYKFKAGNIKGHPFDFSFSGLKTAVLYQIQKCAELTDEIKADIAASFQQAAFESLAQKLLLASQKLPVKSILLGGGVSNSQTLRQFLASRFQLPIFWPPKGLSLDNAAMIAGLGYHVYQRGHKEGLSLEAITRIPFEKKYEALDHTSMFNRLQLQTADR
jgi:N6-L-threonylcarbamoyladenine synthase